MAAPAAAQNDRTDDGSAAEPAASGETSTGAGSDGSQDAATGSEVSSGATQKVAIFPFELIDSSLEGDMMGENPDETARLVKMAPMLREDFQTIEGYEMIDTSSMDERVAGVNLQSCGNCGLSFAEELDADIAVLGTVQKVSNLILNINAYVYDIESGQQIARGSSDIRSNTDQSWERGLDYLFENVIKTQLESRS